VLLVLVGEAAIHRVGDVVAAGAGGVVLAVLLARAFGARRGGQPT
jgi:hypothetical protein